MKRCWFGAGTLVLLFVLGLTVSLRISKFQTSLAADVAQGAQLALRDRAQAQEVIDKAQEKWQKTRSLASGLADHDPMNQADVLFALLTPEAKDADFRENALQLAEFLRQLGQSHLPTLENIF